MFRRTKTPRKLLVKKGSQTSLKDPVGVRPPCELSFVCFLSSVNTWKGPRWESRSEII